MTSSDEKKWFIYVGDHHEGPFSLVDLQGKMAEGVISKASYVWADGMADWVLMTEVANLAPLYLNPGVPVAPTPEMAAALASEIPPLAEDSNSQIAPPVDVNPETGTGPSAQPLSLAISEHVAEPSSPRASFVNTVGGHEITLGSAKLVPLDPPAGVLIPSKAKKEKSRRSGSSSSRRTRKKVVKFATFIVIVALIGGSYRRGYLEPVLKHPMLASSVDKVMGLTQPLLVKALEKAPFLAKFLSPIPQLADVNPDEFRDLRTAALASPDGSGTKFAVAMSKASTDAPVFYVSANVPDGTELKIVFDGIPETLLDASTFNQSLNVKIENKLGKSGPLKAPAGPLPRGQYLITLIEGPQNTPEIQALLARFAPAKPGEKPGAIRALAAKSYFLGGVKDVLYANRLKDFHDKLTKKAKEELEEAKAYADHFEKQLGESKQKFGYVRQGTKIVASRKKLWESFHAKWRKAWGQMEQAFSKWTPDSIQSERYYSKLFQNLIATAQSIEGVHKFQDTLVNGTGDRQAVEIQLGQAESGASTAVSGLKSRIEKIEKSPVSGSGMPAREDGAT